MHLLHQPEHLIPAFGSHLSKIQPSEGSLRHHEGDLWQYMKPQQHAYSVMQASLLGGQVHMHEVEPAHQYRVRVSVQVCKVSGRNVARILKHVGIRPWSNLVPPNRAHTGRVAESSKPL